MSLDEDLIKLNESKDKSQEYEWMYTFITNFTDSDTRYFLVRGLNCLTQTSSYKLIKIEENIIFNNELKMMIEQTLQYEKEFSGSLKCKYGVIGDTMETIQISAQKKK